MSFRRISEDLIIREQIALNADEKPDLTILMSHYGIDGDRDLARDMPDDIHVDMILGGHTHINMDEAEVINDIVIAQSSYGTTHIGRFEVVSLSTYNDLARWFLGRKEKVRVPEKGRFILENFDPATIKK